MHGRHIIIALTCVLYPLQFVLMMHWISLASQGASPVGVPAGLAVNIMFAFLNIGVVRYILRSLDNTRATYAQSAAHQLEQYLKAYQREAEQEERLMQKILQDVDEGLSCASEALATGNHDEMGRYLRMSLDLASKTRIKICDHPAIAAVLEAKTRQCREAHVTLATHVAIPEQIPLPDIEVASVFFNLIDNALHECEALLAEQPASEPCVNVYARVQAGQLFVQVTNPCRPTYNARHQATPCLLGTDRLHGWGLDIVRDLTAKYGGLCEFGEAGDSFTASAMMPLSGQYLQTAASVMPARSL